jgi:hypothetical protein
MRLSLHTLKKQSQKLYPSLLINLLVKKKWLDNIV